ncbi:unnamed protein product [Symbiodinium necroappetens]|uniref:Thioredoxin domain-containing protein n=1 Tax=Symbiodinium necroappetens TaxID=1628268 RepID=A0A812R346_9DINO|nr:unnamed protein product [Symbiodinium necroappetens]
MATSSHRARRLAGVVRVGGCFCAGCCGAAVLFVLVGRLDLGFTSGPPESFRGAGRNRHGPGRTERHCVVETSPSELDAVVRAGGSVVLDVYAVWCGPCKLLEPALRKLAGRLSSGEFDEPGIPSPQVLRLDSDRHSTKATALGVEGLPTVIFYKHGVETGRFEGSVSLSQLEDAAAAALGMVELLDDTGLATEVSSLEELELTVQTEDVLMLGVLGSGKWEQDSAALDGTLQILRRQLGGQMQVLTLDASSLPGVAESLQLGDLPAVVIFQDGQKVMHLEGRDAAAANVDDLQDVLEDVAKSPGREVYTLSVNFCHGKKGKRHGLRSEAGSGS